MSLEPSMEVFSHVLQIALPMLQKLQRDHLDLPWDRFESKAWEIVVAKAEWLGARRELDIRVFRTEPVFREALANALSRMLDRAEASAPSVIEPVAMPKRDEVTPTIDVDEHERTWIVEGNVSAMWPHVRAYAFDRVSVVGRARLFSDAAREAFAVGLRNDFAKHLREQPEVPRIALRWQTYGPALIGRHESIHVAMHRGEILTVSDRWYVDVCEPHGRRWIQRAPRVKRWGTLRAVVSTPDGILGVSRTTIARLVEGTWEELWRGPCPGGAAGALLDGRGSISGTSSGDQLVLWGMPEQRDPRIGATAIWSPKIAWTGFDDADRHPDLHLAPATERRPLRRPIAFRPVLVHDTALDAVLRFGATEVAIWRGGRWQSRALDVVARAVDPVDRAIVHDRATKQTLMLDLVHGIVVRFDVGGSEVVARMPPDHLSTGAAPGSTAFDPCTRQLGSVLARPGIASSVLDLGSVFDAAAPRTPWI